MEYIFENETQLEDFAKEFSNSLKNQDVIAIYGNLGVGKTTFCRALIRGLISNDLEVISPTFNLLQTYQAKDFEIFHFDLYRLKYAEEIFELGIEDAFINGVSLIEWPEIIEDFLPKNTIRLRISSLDNGSRKIIVDKIN